MMINELLRKEKKNVYEQKSKAKLGDIMQYMLKFFVFFFFFLFLFYFCFNLTLYFFFVITNKKSKKVKHSN